MQPVVVCAVCVGLAVLVLRPSAGGRRLAKVRRVPLERRPPARAPRFGARAPVPSLTSVDVALLADQLAALAVAGLPPPRIWVAVAEHGPSPAARAIAAEVVARGRNGVPPAAALRACLPAEPRGVRRGGGSAVVQRAAVVRLAVAVDVSERTGAAAAPTLRRFAEALRADERAARQRAAVLAGPQATAAVLAVLPVAGLLLGALVGARPWHALLATSAGRLCLASGGFLWFVGRRWTAYLVRRATGSSRSGGPS